MPGRQTSAGRTIDGVTHLVQGGDAKRRANFLRGIACSFLEDGREQAGCGTTGLHAVHVVKEQNYKNSTVAHEN
jgi:hypothetical protein